MSSSSSQVDWDSLRFRALGENLADNQRWSTWGSVDRTLARGPQPWPDWLVTSEAAIDTDLGVLKTGKEADVFLLRRAVPDDAEVAEAGWSCLLAAKRYRSTKHRLFHRDTGYTEGRQVRKSRDNRAVARKSEYGRLVESGMWAHAEFATLKQLWTAGVPVPYPVQISGTEILMEFIADGDAAAPRLAQTAPGPVQLGILWGQLVEAMITLAQLGLAHGDLSPYHILVRDADSPVPEAILIDVPQVVDLVSNPQGTEFLHRDCRNVATWFVRRGLPADADALFSEVIAHAW